MRRAATSSMGLRYLQGVCPQATLRAMRVNRLDVSRVVFNAALDVSRRYATSSSTSTTAPQPSPATSQTEAQALLEVMLAAKTRRLTELRAVQDVCHTEAHRYPDRYMFATFAFLVLQAVILFDWTYIHFDWNLVEPITYLLGYSATWIALAWYGNMQEEFGFDSLRAMLESRKLHALYKAKGLDIAEVQRLEEEVVRLRRIVQGAVNPTDPL